MIYPCLISDKRVPGVTNVVFIACCTQSIALPLTRGSCDVMPWKRFLHYQTFVRGTTGNRWGNVGVFFDVSCNELLKNKRLADDIRSHCTHMTGHCHAQAVSGETMMVWETPCRYSLIHCVSVTPHGDTDLGHHRFGHYLNQCWHIAIGVLCHLRKTNFTRYA